MKKILAIDDQKDNLITIAAVIQSQMHDCEIITASSGKEGIAMARNEQPDVILLDIVMPLMDGYEVCQKLKENTQTKHIPIILVTALKTDRESKVKGLNMGADAFISKPIDSIELSAQIKVMLRIKEAEDKLRMEVKSLEKDVLKGDQQLKESEDKYKALYENAPLPYQSLNGDGSFRDINPAWLDTLGYKRNEVIGKFFKDFLHPDWHAHFEKNFPEFKKRGYVSDVQFKIRHKKGHYLDISFEGCIGYNPDGSFKQTYCVFKDITGQKEIEQSLLESEEMFRSLVTNSSDLTFLTNPSGKVNYISPQCESVLGHLPDEIIGQHFPDFIHPDDLDKATKKWEEVYKQGNDIREFEYRIFDSQKKIRWISHSAKVTRFNGQITVVQNTIRNITAQKFAENELQRSKAHLQTLIETIPDLVWLKDPKGIFLTCNKRFEELYGANKSEIIGKTDYDFVDKDLADFFRKNDRAALNAGKALMNEEEVQFASDGHREILETIKTPVKEESGNVIGVLGIARNISDRIATENKLKQSEERYQSFIRHSNEGIYRMEMEEPMDISLPIEKQIDYINQNAFYAECNDAFVKMYGATSTEDILHIRRIDFDKNKNDDSSRNNMRKFIESGYQIYNAESFEQVKDGKWKWFSNQTIGVVEDGKLHRIWGTQLDISDRKYAEDALTKSEERYRSLMENLPVGVFRSTLEGKVISANPAMAKIYGYDSVDELIKLPADEYYHSSNPREKMLSDLKKNKYLLGRETLEHKKDGSLIWVSANYQASFDEKGKIKHLDGVVIDITERKQVEKALMESEVRFKELVELLPEAIFETDKNLQLTYVNKRALEVSGYTEADFDKGINGFSLLSPDSQKKARIYFEKRLKGENPGTIEYEAQRKDGSFYPILFNANSILKNEEFSGLRGIIVDITDKKLAESKLSESQKQYESLFNQIADPIVVFDQKTKKFLHCNTAMIEKYGYSLDELKEMTPLSLHPDTENKINILKNIDDTEKNSPNEYLHQAKDGTIYYVETHTQDIIYKGNKSWITIIRDITERKEIETELKKSEQDYRGLFENAHDAIIIFAPKDEIVLDVNQRACDIYGYNRDEFIGMSLITISHNPVKGKGHIKSTLEKGFHNQFETIHYKKNGSQIFIEVNASIVEFKGQQAILSNNRDITSKKLAEKASQESAEKYRVLYTSTTDAIFLIQDYKFVSCNPRTLEMFSCKKEEIIGYSPMDFSPKTQPNGKPSIKLALQKMNSTLAGEPQTFEWLHLKKDGTPFNAEITLTKMVLSDGEYVHAIVRDITERKRSELIQKTLYNISNTVITSNDIEELISTIQKYLGSIIDTKNFYIGLYDKETKTIKLPYVADQFDEVDDFPAERSMTGYVIETKKSLLVNATQQEEMVAKGLIDFVGTRSKIWLGVPLKINGEVQGALVVQSYDDESAYNKSDMEMLEFVSDQISLTIHRKNAEQNLKNALKKATESDRLKSTFLATMSHELRTPLNAIIGFSDIINENMPADEIMKFVETINTSGNHLLNIVEDLFDITLIESGQIKIVKEDFQLISILNNVYEIIKSEQKRTNKENLKLKLITPDNTNHQIIHTDRSKFKQILINLLKNAIKFTSKGEIAFGFKAVNIQEKAYLQFFVSDTGIGISEEQQKFIFEMFRQADETYSTAYGGTGIGLSITKKLTELLGGNIWIESESGKGSIFFFTIPLEKALEEGKNTDLKANTSTSIKSKTILIVEDVEASYELLKAMLKSTGVNLLWAQNGKEAVAICEKNPEIDLVLMDINMPIMNGYEATRLIKARRPELPIIAQTAYAIIGDREKSIEAGCNDYITKPIKRLALINTIEKYII